MSIDCVVGPPRSEPLIGQVVLDSLDLIADCRTQTLAAASGVSGLSSAEPEIAHGVELATVQLYVVSTAWRYRMFPVRAPAVVWRIPSHVRSLYFDFRYRASGGRVCWFGLWKPLQQRWLRVACRSQHEQRKRECPVTVKAVAARLPDVHVPLRHPGSRLVRVEHVKPCAVAIHSFSGKTHGPPTPPHALHR